MITYLEILLLIADAIVAVPVAVLFIECMSAMLPRRRASERGDLPPRIGVLISAHNEELLIQPTVRSIMRQLRPADSLLVVADNCNDQTAELAQIAGARVVKRHDSKLRGKGYGLNFGLQRIGELPPDVMVFFDADQTIEPGVVQTLARQAWQHRRPIQAEYLLAAPKSAGARGTVSTLAFIVKNAVRPVGLARLGLPCALTGTGMAFPWELIESAPLASGHLVEDMELGIHFVQRGCGPKLCTDVTIHGEMAGDNRAAYVQRTRWEHGHLSVITAHALPLLWDGIRKMRLDLIATGLDLTVPPLALLAGLWLMGATASVGFGIYSTVWSPAILFAASGAMIALAIASAWRKHARHLPVRALLAVPGYVLWKVPLYVKFLFQRQTTWVRTERPTTPPGTGGAAAA